MARKLTIEDLQRMGEEHPVSRAEILANLDRDIAIIEAGSDYQERIIPRPGRPSDLPEPWQSLADHAGSVQRLAAEFGVTVEAIRRWANGTRKMSGPAAKIFEQLLLALPKEDDMQNAIERESDGSIKIEDAKNGVTIIPQEEGLFAVFRKDKINNNGHRKAWERRFKTEAGAIRWAKKILQENA